MPFIEEWDNFVKNSPASNLTNPSTRGAINTLQEARATYHIQKKAERVQDILNKVEGRGESGALKDVNQGTRTTMNQLIQKAKGYTPDELEAMKKVAYGAMGQGTLNLVGKLSPNIPSSLVYGGIGAATGHLWPLLLGGIGYGAKATSKAITNRNANYLSRLILSGGDKSKLIKPLNKYQVEINNNRELLENILRVLGIQTGNFN